MVIKNEKANWLADQSAEKNEKITHRDYITALPVLKETVEIYVEDFENLVRSDTKMMILTELFENKATVTQDVLFTILGVEKGRK
jgi:hypothetical protein|nr:MAG TPA: hypothetical protein [Caudoviricetes sp.]